jgi:hypothetical protein
MVRLIHQSLKKGEIKSKNNSAIRDKCAFDGRVGHFYYLRIHFCRLHDWRNGTLACLSCSSQHFFQNRPSPHSCTYCSATQAHHLIHETQKRKYAALTDISETDTMNTKSTFPFFVCLFFCFLTPVAIKTSAVSFSCF